MEAKRFLITALLVYVSVASGSVYTSSASRNPQSAQSQTPIQSLDERSTVSVRTTSGLLNGSKQALKIGNSSIYKFLSVPYAEAPIGHLRFQRPVELKDRSDVVVDASKFGKTCPQYRHLTRFISPLLNIDNEHQISEDCLHLNIYVPSSVGSILPNDNNKLEPNKQLPVILWIPGEGFDFADARQYDGSYLAHKTQSIVITVQYRVGVLGFLQVPKLNIKGNMGVYDQIMSLRWIRKNIGSFGGDAERVTLMGRFSGSMSISAMITAPNQELIKSDGQLLFSRVAMLSGVAVDDWIIESSQAERVKQLEGAAVSEGFCASDDDSCLQFMPLDQLLRISNYGWRLVVDGDLIGSHSPIDAVKMNQFASQLEGVVIGETGMEGTLCLYRHMLDTRSNNYAQLIEEDRLRTSDFYEILRDDSQTYFKTNISRHNPIQAALETMVEVDGQEQENESVRLRERYLDACSSYMIKSHSNRLKRNIMSRNHFISNRMDSSKKPVEVFHYELKYKPTFSLAPDYIKTAVHGDDIPLIFGLVYNQPKADINEADLLMTRKMMAYIGNFVHGNNPLLNQHPTIEQSRHEFAQKATETEATSMDENESSSSSNPISRRNWSSEGLVHVIEFNEDDSNEIRVAAGKNLTATQADVAPYSSDIANKEPRIYLKSNEKSNLGLILIESSQPNVRSLPMWSLFELRHQQIDEPTGINQATENQVPISKSQRLLELHRQQIVEENPWALGLRRNAQTSQQQPQALQTTMTLVNESSYMMMVVFSSCIVIFTLMSLCLALCLIIFRSNLSNKQSMQQFANSLSTCNICDESQGSSIDAVLDRHRKDGRGFNNVFAKLRNHNNSIALAQAQPQCTSASTTTTRQQTNVSSELAINQQAVSNEPNPSGHLVV